MKLQYSVVRTAELAHINTKMFVKLRNKCALVREGPGYPRNGTPMGVSILALAHLVVKRTIHEAKYYSIGEL